MDQPAPNSSRASTERFLPLLLSVLALVMYGVTLSPAPFPGLPAQALVEQLWLAPPVPVLSPVWGMVVRILDRMPFLTVAAWTGWFSAGCGAACVGLTAWLMLRVRYRGLSVDDRIDRAQREAEARILSAGVAGLYMACCIPFWVAATRSLPATFHMLMLIAAAGWYSLYQREGKIRQLAALGLLYGVGMTEFATFLLYLPVALFLVLRDEYRNGVLKDWRRHFALGGGGLTGLSLYLVHAGWRVAQGNGDTFTHVLAQTLREQAAGILMVRFNTGFIALMFLATVPWLMIFVLSRRSPWFYDLDQILVRFVFLYALLAVLYNAPFAFWNFLGIRYLMLTPHLLVAACTGYMAGECWILGGCLLPSDASVWRRIVRWSCRWLARAMPALVLLGGALNWRTANAREGADIYAAVLEILDRMETRDLLFTNGVLDDLLRLAARERKQPLKIINVQQMNSPVYLQQLVGDFEDESIRKALKEGKLPLFFDELLQPEAGLARVAILDMPDGFRPYGHLIPDALLYRLVPDSREEDVAVIAARQRGFQERMMAVADRLVPEGNPVHLYHRILLAQAAKIANNLGVMQAEAGDFAGAAEDFRRALEMDAENLSARMNRMEIARRQGSPDLEAWEAEWTEWLNRGWETRWGLSMHHGYLWNAGEWMKRGHAWAGSGSPTAQEGSRRRDPVADLREAEIRQLLDQVYDRWGKPEIDEILCRNRLLKNGRDAGALRNLLILSMGRNDLDAAAAYAAEAAAVGLDESLLAFDRAMMMVRLEGRERAVDALKTLVKENPSLDQAWLAIGLLTDPSTAANRQAMGYLLNMPAGNPGFQLALAWIHMGRAEWTLAHEELEAVVRVDPQSRIAWELMYVLGQIQDNSRLVQASQQALLGHQPDHPLQILQTVLPLIQDHQWNDAEMRLRSALRRDRHPELLNALGNLIAEQGGDWAEAMALIDEALLKQPFNPRFRCARGELNRKAGRTDEAEKDLQSVLELIPGHSLALLMLAEYSLDQGEVRRASEYLQALTEVEPNLRPEHRVRLQMLEKAIHP